MTPDRRSLLHDTEGAYQAEYTIVLVLVALVAALAIGTLGVPLIQYYRSIQTTIVSPGV